MKIICDNIKSEEVSDIFKNFDLHRENYIKIEWVEVTKGTRGVSVIDRIGVKGESVLVNDVISGTRYIYDGELLFTKIKSWMLEQLPKEREKKLVNLGL